MSQTAQANEPRLADWHSPEMKDLSRKYWFKRFKRKIVDRIRGTKSQRFLSGCIKIHNAGSLLDIGCGTGNFILEASEHYECTGIEPSPYAASACAHKGINVICSSFEDADLGESKFDIITMDGVIEHVRNPLDVLKKCKNLLKPGGCVGMITPNLAGPSYLWHRSGWNGFRAGYHTFLFTGRTLKRCIRQSGLDVVTWPQRDWPFIDDGLIIWAKNT